MAVYKCGYCGKPNEGDIWCSEAHRQLWYEQRQHKVLDAQHGRPGRIGPHGRATGGARRAQNARAKKP